MKFRAEDDLLATKSAFGQKLRTSLCSRILRLPAQAALELLQTRMHVNRMMRVLRRITWTYLVLAPALGLELAMEQMRDRHLWQVS